MRVIVRGPSRADRFTILSNAVLQDERLSYRARGVLASLLSRPEGWSVSSERLARDGEGRDAIRTVMRELEAAGYLATTREQGADGKWSTTITVFEEPQGTEAGSTGAGSADVGSSGATERTSEKEPTDADSLRSSAETSGGDPGCAIARAYWDRHVEEREGTKPGMRFIAIAAVARRALKDGCTPDEIVDALMAHQRAVATGPSVIAKVAEARRVAAERPATGVISSQALQIRGHLRNWAHDTGVGQPRDLSGVDWAVTMAAVSALLSPGFGMSPSEVIARIAVRWRHAGIGTVMVPDLIDPNLPVARGCREGHLPKILEQAYRVGAHS